MYSKKYIIGITSHYHDSSACLFEYGKLVFACEEERFTKIKHDSSFPINTLNYIFEHFKIKQEDIECVCFYEDPKLKIERVKNNLSFNFHSISSYFDILRYSKEIDRLLKTHVSDKIFYSNHHESHLYYSMFTSPFKSTIGLSVDGVGEHTTIVYASKNGSKIDFTDISEYPHSLGLFYSAMTSYLGFKPNEGEYKFMGLASFGNGDFYYDKIKQLISYNDGELNCNMKFFTWNRDGKIMFNEKLTELLEVEQRLPNEEINQSHKDLAASVQNYYEEILFKIISDIHLIEKNTNLCLGGGCAYNGSANGKIIKNTKIRKLWIPSAPSDAGSSIGACINYLHKTYDFDERVNPNPFLGPKYEIEPSIKLNRKFIEFLEEEKLFKYVAEQLEMGKVVAWYQDNMEFGSRALGNRSILANPMISGMKERINTIIKKRESFRPFAPMVTKERQDEYFVINGDVPYMNQVVKVKKSYQKIFTETTHVDGTARIQTVYNDMKIHKLLTEFEKLTGYPVLLNTSFNIKDQTIVLTPLDAIQTFEKRNIDILVLNNYILYK